MSCKNQETQGMRKVRSGLVVSNKMDKTIVVKVERTYQHPLMKKYITQHKKYYAHDAENACNIGDTVSIAECRPLSAQKRWRLENIIKRAK